jgi:hypothetical protein
LPNIVRTQLASYVVDNVEALLPPVSILDAPRLLEAMKSRSRHE